MLSNSAKKTAFVGLAMCISASASAYTISFDHGTDADGVATSNVAGATVINFNNADKSNCGGYGGCAGNFTFHQGSAANQYSAPTLRPGTNDTRYFSDPEDLSTDNRASLYLQNRTANYFGLLWGSIDPFNSISFINGFQDSGRQLVRITGADITQAAEAQGYSLADHNNSAYVNLFGLPDFNTIRFNSVNTAFESDNHAYATLTDVPEPSALVLFGLGLLGMVGLGRRRGMI